MNGFGFLLSGRWLRFIALAVLASAVCMLLAAWQNDRRATRDHEIAVIEANYHADPIPLAEALPERTAPLPDDEEWKHVIVTGEYAPSDTVLARNRPKDGRGGFYAIVPLHTATGTIAVARGWIGGVAGDVTAADVPAPPAGEVEVSLWLRPAQDGTGDNNSPGTIRSIDPRQVPGMDDAYTGAYGYLDAESPAPEQSLESLPKPNTDPGSHLSYTMQWILFGVMVFVGLGYAARRERDAARTGDSEAGSSEPSASEPDLVVVDKARLRAGGATAVRSSRYPTVLGGRKRTRIDDAAEDALLDEQLG